MIEFQKKILANGLQVVVNVDTDTPLATLNVMYKAGSRNENPDRTGLAHLLEHCMFTGTEAFPDYDEYVQTYYGENNAYTTTDITNYYITLPAQYIEQAFAIEADRMWKLPLFEQGFLTQRSVVMEEMKQRTLNKPYGDYGHLLRDMIYKKHPYRWPVIGLTLDHIEGASREDLLDFYNSYYTPDNAVVVVSGNVCADEIFAFTEKYFGIIEKKGKIKELPQEPRQDGQRVMHVEREVPTSRVTLAYKMGTQISRDFYIADLITDVLADGDSSLLPNELVRNKRLCLSADASVNDSIDPGYVMLNAVADEENNADKENLLEDIAEELRRIIRQLPEKLTEYDFEKAKNRAVVSRAFGQLKCQDKAPALALGTVLGDTNLVNIEFERFASVTKEEIKEFVERVVVPDNECVLYYHKKV